MNDLIQLAKECPDKWFCFADIANKFDISRNSINKNMSRLAKNVKNGTISCIALRYVASKKKGGIKAMINKTYFKWREQQ